MSAQLTASFGQVFGCCPLLACRVFLCWGEGADEKIRLRGNGTEVGLN